MITVELEHAADFDGWRTNARRLLREGHDPAQVIWQCDGSTADLFGNLPASAPQPAADGHKLAEPVASGALGTRVSRDFVSLARRVVCHRDPLRFALLYRLLWRQARGEHGLLHNACDAEVHRVAALGKAVSRDMHKMRAFLRFRRSSMDEVDHYHAWFEPEHHILRFNCEFFQRRFAAMHWSIATPEGSAHWNGETLRFGPAVSRDVLPASEPMEDLWRTYFASIFNPARLRLNAMRSEMPMKYWKNLPEASLIAPLTHAAGARTGAMVDAAPTQPPRFAARALHAEVRSGRNATTVEGADPARAGVVAHSLADLAHEVKGCERCAHACLATQAVPGVGLTGSALMLVGEQPGDREDLEGRPFAGPAGQLLRELLDECDADSRSIYLTNAVKHFKFSVRGKLRLHQRPADEDIVACQPWLQREIELVQPRIIVALGASAARALLGRQVKVQAMRGQWQAFSNHCRVLITTHPAFVLRQRSADESRRARTVLREDLALAISAVSESRTRASGRGEDAGVQGRTSALSG